jgi:hypothetical protein
LILGLCFYSRPKQKSLYDILSVPRTATTAEIKKAYHRMALACHPDKHPDDPNAKERCTVSFVLSVVNEAVISIVNEAVISLPLLQISAACFCKGNFNKRREASSV